MANPMLLPVLQWARRLRYPTLFKLTAGLFALTLFIPDPIPFVAALERYRDDTLLAVLEAVKTSKAKHGMAFGD